MKYSLWAYVDGIWREFCPCEDFPGPGPSPGPALGTWVETMDTIPGFFATQLNNNNKISGLQSPFVAGSGGYLDALTLTFTSLSSDMVVGVNDANEILERTNPTGAGWPPSTNWPSAGYGDGNVENYAIGPANQIQAGRFDATDFSTYWNFYFYIAIDSYANIIEDFTINVISVSADVNSGGYMGTVDVIWPKVNASGHICFNKHVLAAHPTDIDYQHHIAKFYNGTAVVNFPGLSPVWSRADDLNDDDIVVGASSETNWEVYPVDRRAFRWDTDTGEIVYLDELFTAASGNTNHAWGINNLGHIVWGWLDGTDWHVCVTNMTNNVEIGIAPTFTDPTAEALTMRAFINDNEVVVIANLSANKIAIYTAA